MQTYTAQEAEEHFAKILERVLQGEEIAITTNGEQVALILPCEDSRRKRIASAIAHLEELRKGVRLDGLTIRELIEEGRD